MKTCPRCTVKKSVKKFSTDPNRKGGLSYYCKKCHREYVKRRRKEVRKDLNEYKKTLECIRCGFDDWRALAFHHRDPKEKKDSIANMTHQSWKALTEEIKKCDVLCSNCHAIEHHEI